MLLIGTIFWTGVQPPSAAAVDDLPGCTFSGTVFYNPPNPGDNPPLGLDQSTIHLRADEPWGSGRCSGIIDGQAVEDAPAGFSARSEGGTGAWSPGSVCEGDLYKEGGTAFYGGIWIIGTQYGMQADLRFAVRGSSSEALIWHPTPTLPADYVPDDAVLGTISVAPGAWETCNAQTFELQIPREVSCPAATSGPLRTGDVIDDVGIAAEVPPPGESVQAISTNTTGIEELKISRSAAGAVVISDCGSETATEETEEDPASDPNDPPPAPGDPPPPEQNPPPAGSDSTADPSEDLAAGAPRACKDRTYKLDDRKWFTTLHWLFNDGTTPGSLSKNSVESDLVQATNAIPNLRNSCGLQDNVTASAVYDGRTTVRANIKFNAQKKPVCSSASDGASVIDFGDLNPSDTLAIQCAWATSSSGVDSQTESDVRLNKDDIRFTTSPKSASCSGRWGIAAVATHERGHTFGLDHVGETKHGNLTMSTKIGPCQDSESTLGYGDVRGLRKRY